MKLEHIFEDPYMQNDAYKQWQRMCRKAFPNCTFVGDTYQAQAVDWTSINNEVAGDWEKGKGMVYKPGTMGREVLEQIG